ncbi:unnamed protein product [Effrenium voratum]|uniref:Uncharacterized protein n=1 Tax=Effrenium voratum TaxID=2562239 RepID=A0AA36JD99_9DINO|nr:unnamed protein product [Effrenium voratum]
MQDNSFRDISSICPFKHVHVDLCCCTILTSSGASEFARPYAGTELIRFDRLRYGGRSQARISLESKTKRESAPLSQASGDNPLLEQDAQFLCLDGAVALATSSRLAVYRFQLHVQVASSSKRVYVWDVAAEKVLAAASGHSRPISCLRLAQPLPQSTEPSVVPTSQGVPLLQRLSPCLRYLGAPSEDGSVCVARLADAAVAVDLQPRTGSMVSAGFDGMVEYPEETEITPLGVEGDYVAPAARDLYFAQEPNLIAPFDFDYETIINFTTNLRWAQLLFLPPAWFSVACCYPCFLQQNVEWEVRSQHVALTVDGIRFVKEKRKSMCGLPCTDKGRESKTVPYDKITDCDVMEPAGTACCCCIPRLACSTDLCLAEKNLVTLVCGTCHWVSTVSNSTFL